jgi:hypothetical protein
MSVMFEGVTNTFRRLRSVGGKVTVTNRRLLFTPNRLDGLLGACLAAARSTSA